MRLRSIIRIFLLSISLFLLASTPTFAQERIDNFVVSIVAHKDGSMHVEETITYDFGSTSHHGIYRTIPLVSRVGSLYRVISLSPTMVMRDGKSEQYDIQRHAQETTIKIGDPDRTISGVHYYTIGYTVHNGIGSNYTDHDEIYWNATGNEWNIPIDHASVEISTDFGVIPGKTICFTGSVSSRAQACDVADASDRKIISANTVLNPSEGLTFVTSFPLGTFPKSTLRTTPPTWDPDFLTFLKFVIPVYLALNLLLAPYLLFWYNKHKNKGRLGPPAVHFDLPEYPQGKRITPAEAGTLDNARLDKDDIIATIYDLAIRKYLRIEQVKKEGKFLGLGSSTDFQFVKLKEFAALSDFEKTVMESLFGAEDSMAKAKQHVLLSKQTFTYTDFTRLEKKNFSQLVARGFYKDNPKERMRFLLMLGIVACCTGSIILGPVLLFLSWQLTGRTELGDTLDHQIDGLKLFLKGMERNYQWQAENFSLVEAMIPYAMALGFIEEYMKQLKILYPEYQPTWYHGRGHFYSVYPYFGSSLSNTITTSAPSSSSGFSSGGFSGGGGGGGGGGSW